MLEKYYKSVEKMYFQFGIPEHLWKKINEVKIAPYSGWKYETDEVKVMIFFLLISNLSNVFKSQNLKIKWRCYKYNIFVFFAGKRWRVLQEWN